ncbi:phosphotriesterase [Parapedobacter sp. GCM10030251]|uniref:phosphotriesterase family protein n=1 Tax=Parapedobacter sp. GCM10030251 TaxID=3273419 RepID=UPI0036164162
MIPVMRLQKYHFSLKKRKLRFVKMKRRTFIQKGFLSALPLAGIAPPGWLLRPSAQVMTVNGPIAIDKLGTVLPHEHILVDFIGADQVNPKRYDQDEVFAAMLPYLEDVRRHGVRTFVDCTPEWIGRDAHLLKRLSDASGMHIVTNTGYYGAAGEKYLPPHAYTETAEQLAERWVAEWRNGIGDTGIKPGFIKTGVDGHPLSATQRKLIRAAALTHLQTGLTIFVHTGDGRAALEELAILTDTGAAPDAWVWTHAQSEPDRALHIQAAEAGGWVAFDGLYPQLVDRYVAFLRDLKARRLLHRALISHDAGWYEVGKPDGGRVRPYVALFQDLIPALKKAGFTAAERRQLFETNPAEALAVRIREKYRPQNT